MADKQISQLVAATTINDEDLFAMQQGNTAKKASGRLLKEVVDGEINNFALIKEDAFNGEIFKSASIETERVEYGTLIKNQLWVTKCSAIVGYAYDLSDGVLYFYGVYGYKIVPKSRKKLYRLLYKDSEDAPFELTLENAPQKAYFTSGVSDNYGVYKFRQGLTNVQDHVDYRLCAVYYNENGEEEDRIYSAQYRYTINTETGAVTRVKFNTANTDPTHIIDIGLFASDASMATTYNFVDKKTGVLKPLVSNLQDIQYRFIVPDSYFDNALYGLAIIAVMGDGTRYSSGSFFKAEDKVAELEEEVFSAIDANQAEFYAENFLGAPALTERVEGGTLLKNQLWVNKTVSHVGFAYDQDAGKLWFYAIFGYAYKTGWTNRSYIIIYKDSPDPARELTLEDTDYVNEIQNPEWIMKYRAGSTTITHHADIRYCRVVYDENGNEVETIYSAQYRFTIENGAATRTRFETAPTDPSHIIDIGLLKNNNSVAESFAYSDPTITRAIQPLVSTIQTAAFQFIIPDSMFNGTDHGLSVVALTGDLNRFVTATFHKAEDRIGELETEVFDALKEEHARFSGEIIVGSPALTERVEDGTWLKNQLWLDKCVAVVGYCYDSSVSKTYLYSIFGSNVPAGGSQKSYNLIAKDSETEVELTLETAPISSEISGATAFYTCKTNISNVQDHFDYRVCRVHFDGNGNEIERIYSAQYRYTISNNAATRVRFNTADQDESYIVDLGVVVANSATSSVFDMKITANRTILPLVSTPQTYEYKFIIPDSMFDNAPYGLCIVAVNGLGEKYISSNFFKAEDKSPFIVTLTPTAQDFSGTMDKTVAEITTAYQAGRQIVFKMYTSATTFIEVPVSLVGYDSSDTYPSFETSVIQISNNLLIYARTAVTSGGTNNLYYTTIYPLTPMN